MPDLPSAGMLIRRARRKRKGTNGKRLTQEGLAERLGVSVDTVSGWETNAHRPQPGEREALVQEFPELAEDFARLFPKRHNVRIPSPRTRKGGKRPPGPTTADGHAFVRAVGAARAATKAKGKRAPTSEKDRQAGGE